VAVILSAELLGAPNVGAENAAAELDKRNKDAAENFIFVVQLVFLSPNYVSSEKFSPRD